MNLPLPAPTTVLMYCMGINLYGTLWPEITASLYRIGMGYAIGCILGVVIGTVLGFSKLRREIRYSDY